MAKFTLVLILSMLAAFSASAQVLTSEPHTGVEQVPLGDAVYPFLRHLSVRGIIQGYSEAELPLSEFEVREFLYQADSQKLSGAERELLTKFLRTYAHEPREVVTMFPSKDAEPLFWGGIFTDKDKYIYRWFNDSTKSDFYLNGIASVEGRHKFSPETGSLELANLGGRFYGTLTGHVGYFFQATNGVTHGDSSLALEDPLLAGNRNFAIFTHQYFSNTTAELTYTDDWFTGKLAREGLAIGGGYQNDNVILSSSEVPLYDFVSLAGKVGVVRYEAVLASLTNDSVTIYPGLKYSVWHDLTVDITKDFELGYTDNIIFSDRLVLGYLNPFSWLKAVEWGTSDQDKDNANMSLHGRWRIVPGFELRGQGLVDDVVFSNIGKGYWSNKFAWQLGGMWAGAFGIPDLDFEAEWTHVEPYTYTHWSTDDNRYTNAGTLLGPKIGPNAMSYWGMLRWAPNAKWTFSLSGTLTERGENIYDSTGNLLYNAGADYNLSMNDKGAPNDTHFLEGRQVNIISITGDIEFEPWRGLTFFARGTKSSVDYLSEAPSTPGFNLSSLPISYAPQSLPETIIAVGAQALF